MNRTIWPAKFADLWFQAIIVAVAAVNTFSTTRAAEVGKKNVLFIVADDMNTHLGCYGHDVITPAIDSLAKRGMRFDHAYCQVSVCNPSRVSFLSGLRPDHTQVYTLIQPTRSHLGDWLMLPEYFRKNGYFTAGIGKVFHTDMGFEDPRSWDLEVREFGKRPPADQIVKSGQPAGGSSHTSDWEWLKTPDEQTPDGIVARKSIEIMRRCVAEKKPFFLGVGFRRPHAPYAAPQRYFESYPLAKIPLAASPPNGHYDALLPSSLGYERLQKPYTEKEQRELVAAYYACISFVDAQVDTLLKALGELKLWDNTIVVFLGDHGYHLGEHGGLWHKMSLFEEGVHVPLIIYSPTMKAAGKPCHQLVEFIDLYPTLVAQCELPKRANLDGVDLTSLLNDPTNPVKTAAYSLTTRGNRPDSSHEKEMAYLGRSIRTDRWRYTEWDHGQRGNELYDHNSDPQEWHNLANDPAHADVVAEMKRLLAAECSTVPH